MKLDRRSALKFSASLASAAALSRLTGKADESNPWKTAIGLNGFMSSSRKYDQRFPLWEILDWATRIGFQGVELVEGWPEGYVYPSPDQDGRIRSLKRFYDEYNLQIFSIQNGASGAFAPNQEARDQWLNRMRSRLRVARAIGCECFGLWPGGGLRGQTVDEAIGHLARSLREIAKMGEDLGIVTAFEIEPPFVFNSEKHLLDILDRAKDSRVKTIYDPSHFDLFHGSKGAPHELLQQVGVDRIGYIHFTDTDGTIRDGGTSKHLPVGQGHIDVDASLSTLKRGGFQGWIMIDAWQVPDPYEASLKGRRAIARFQRNR